MASTTIDPLAVLLAAEITAIGLTPTIKVHKWDPGTAGIDSLPAGVISVPTIRRVGVDEAESQLGTRDWIITFPVTLAFDLADPAFTQAQAIEYVEAFIKRIDTDNLQASDASILDAKVTLAEPSEVVDQARPRLDYDCTVEVLKLV